MFQQMVNDGERWPLDECFLWLPVYRAGHSAPHTRREMESGCAEHLFSFSVEEHFCVSEMYLIKMIH